jgi:DNA-binding NarL/FixJ family response regulator
VSVYLHDEAVLQLDVPASPVDTVVLPDLPKLSDQQSMPKAAPSILVVGADEVIAGGVARAIDPVSARAIGVTADQAAMLLSRGDVKVVVLLPRAVEPTQLLAAVRKARVNFVVAAAGIATPPPSVSELRPVVVQSLQELTQHVDRVVGLTTDLALTGRHIEILQRLAEGDTPTEAADTLGITVKTLNNHLGVVYRRLGARNVTQAVLTAVRAGLVRL